MTFRAVVNSSAFALFAFWRISAKPSGRAVYGVYLRPLACWDFRCESRWGHGYLSFVSVVWCQVVASASDWSLVQRSPTNYGVSVIVKPTRDCRAMGGGWKLTQFLFTKWMFTSINEFFLMRCVGEAVDWYKCCLFIVFFLILPWLRVCHNRLLPNSYLLKLFKSSHLA